MQFQSSEINAFRMNAACLCLSGSGVACAQDTPSGTGIGVGNGPVCEPGFRMLKMF